MKAARVYEDGRIGRVIFTKNPKSCRIGIRVHPDKGVTVSVPFFTSYDTALKFYMSKRDAVLRAVERQKSRQAEAESAGRVLGVFGDGAAIRTLLSEIRFSRGGDSASVRVETETLEILSSSGRKYLSPDRPVVRKTVVYPASMPAEGSDALSSALAGILLRILREEAGRLLPAKLSCLAERYGFSYGRVAIKHNSSNWGSCSSKGNINLNLNLVRLPEAVCDYVILHELCHLRYMNHGDGFHALLESLCRDNMECLYASGASSDPYTAALSGAIGKSRARYPVHYVLEREVRKYRPL